MTIADAQSLAGLTFAGFMITVGLLQLVMPLGSKRWGDPRGIERLAGLFGILLGIFYLRRPLDFVHEPLFLLTFGGFALLMALYLLLIEPRLEARKLQRYEAELSRQALAADDYSESLRAFHANSPFTQHPLRRLLSGAMLILFGATWLALALIITR